MMHALTHAGSVALLVLLFHATGSLIERVAPWGELRTIDRGLARITAGIIGWIAGLFVLACVGGLRRIVVLPIVAGVILAAAPGLIRSGRDLLSRLRRRPAEDAPLFWRRAGARLLPLAAPGAVLVAIFVVALAPQIGWDDDTYHLTLPRLYLAQGGFLRVPFSVYSHWPQAVELLYALAMIVHDYVTAKLLHGLFLALLLFAVYRVGRRRVSSLAGILAALLVLGNQVLLNEAPVAYVDIAVAFFFFMAVALAWEHLDSGSTAPLLLSGFCCGALAGCKLSGLIGLACVLALVVATRLGHSAARPASAVARTARAAPGRLARVAGCLLLPTLLLAIPWYVKSWVETGDPFYPLLYRYLGGVEWSADLGRQFLEWQRSIGMGRSPADFLALPFRLILSGGPGYDRFDGSISALWIVLVPLAAAAALRVAIIRRALLPAAAYFLAWALFSQQMRFLIPVLPLLALSAGASIEALLGTLGRPARRVAGGILVMGACLWLLLPARPILAEAGRVGSALLGGGPGRLGPPIPPGYAFINARTPADAKIMLLNTNHGFFLEREYIADSFFEASQMNALLLEARSATEMRQLMNRLGITHVYVASRDWGIPYPQALWEFLGDPGSAELVYTCPGEACFVFRLRPTGS
jgi:hypothetical protein